MGVKKLLVQGGTFQNPILFTGSYLSRTPSIPSPGAPGHPARKEASSPPPTPGPSAGNPRTTLGTLTTFLGGWAPPLGLETRLWAYSLPRGTRRPRPTGPVTLQRQDTPRMGGLPVVPRSCSLPTPGPLLLGAWAEAGPWEEAFLCHPVPSSAFVRLCLCSPHCQAASTSWKALRMCL